MNNFLKNLLPKKKLHIFFRHTSTNDRGNKNRPDWFSYEMCFKNLVNSILINSNMPLDVYLNVIFDGSESDLNNNFLKKMDSFFLENIKAKKINYSLVLFNGGSALSNWKYSLEYINKKNYSPNDYIYMLENDYLHVDNWIFFLNELLESKIKFDYISLYDHKDKYPFHKGFHPMHANLNASLFVTEHRHWRTSPSTCGSFITSVRTFSSDMDVLNTELMDHEIFDRLSQKDRVLITPLPGLATHCMNDLLSPCIDWKNISKSASVLD